MNNAHTNAAEPSLGESLGKAQESHASAAMGPNNDENRETSSFAAVRDPSRVWTEPTPRDDQQGPIGEGGWRRLDSRYIPAEIIGSMIGTLIISGGIAIGLLIVFALGVLGESFVWALVGGMAFILLMVLLTFVQPPLSYRYTSFSINSSGLRIRRGILWRHLIQVPRSRIQHTDVTQGPLQRHFGIATLVVYTAGTSYASVDLSGLDYSFALLARDFLVRGGGDDAV